MSQNKIEHIQAVGGGLEEGDVNDVGIADEGGEEVHDAVIRPTARLHRQGKVSMRDEITLKLCCVKLSCRPRQ